MDGKNYLANVYSWHLIGIQIECSVVRFHNIFGPKGTWVGGKKAPAARRKGETTDGGEIEAGVMVCNQSFTCF